MSDAAPVSQFPVLDREGAHTFLHCLDPDIEKFTFQTFTDSDERKKTYQINPRTGQIADPLAKVFHGTLDEHWASLVDASRLGAGIFVTVNRTTLCGRRNRENIVGVRAYFVDCDGVPPDEIKAGILALGLMPHIGVQSSSGRYHCYWCVRDAALTEFSETQKKLIALFGSDPQVCDLPRVMRIPGFPHQKDGSNGELVRLVYTRKGEDYSDAGFQNALTSALMLRASQKPLKDRALEGFGKPPPDWSQGADVGERNTECARMAGAAIGEGANFEEALERCLRWNLLNRPPLDEAEVSSVVTSIWKTHARKQGANADDFFAQNDDPQTESLKTFRGDELLSTAALPRRWLVEGFVPADETTMLGGDGGTGKTTLALQLAVAAISGGDWLGHKVARCNILYVSAEDPVEEIHFRLEQIAKGLGLSDEILARFKLIDLAGEIAAIAVFDKNGQIKPTQTFAKIEDIAREHSAGGIIFDAVADFFGGNENERREVRAFVSSLRGLAMRLGAAVIFLAHPSVDGIKTGRGYSGSTHWNNAVRSRLYFTDVKEESDAPADPDMRVIELAKSNRARRGEKIYAIWEAGRFVVAAPGATRNLEIETATDELFLRLLSKAGNQGQDLSPSRSPSYAPTVLARWPGSKGTSKAALERAMHRLLEAGKIRVETFGPPSKLRHRLIIGSGST